MRIVVEDTDDLLVAAILRSVAEVIERVRQSEPASESQGFWTSERLRELFADVQVDASELLRICAALALGSGSQFVPFADIDRYFGSKGQTRGGWMSSVGHARNRMTERLKEPVPELLVTHYPTSSYIMPLPLAAKILDVLGEAAPNKPAHGLTPRKKFRSPILNALARLGGSGATADVLDEVGAALNGKLSEQDLQRLPSPPHELRWRNTAQWARFDLVKEGLLDAESPRGRWALTEKGWAAAREADQ